MDNIPYWLVRSSSRRGGVVERGWSGEIVTLASYKFYFLRVHDNRVKNPSDNKSIYINHRYKLYGNKIKKCIPLKFPKKAVCYLHIQ